MKKTLLECLRCLVCAKSEWGLEIRLENAREIREGTLRCGACGKNYEIKDGVLNALGELDAEEAHEKEHAESLGYLVTSDGEKHSINQDTIDQFRDVFLKLPAGDGSHFFQPGGSFDNQAGNADRFFEMLELLNLREKQKVLEVGAGFGWASRRFAQRGLDVVAVDMTDYLRVSDLYLEQDGIYYERVMADINRLPFKDGSFDLIFSHSVMHHSKDLGRLFGEFYRRLRPGGRLVALHECAFGLLEDKSGKALREAIAEGFNENAYTLPQWKEGAKKGGFRTVRFHFFSMIDGYISRKKQRNAPLTAKLQMAYWVKKHPLIHRLINRLLALPRIFLRPKAWMILAEK